MRWSVTLEASGDRTMRREEIVELADAVAGSSGIATGIGTTSYGAQLVVEAANRSDAIEQATAIFHAAVARAMLPGWPVERIKAISESEEDELAEQSDFYDEDTFGTPTVIHRTNEAR